MSLADEQRRFDLRIAESFVAFLNGGRASVFDWVPAELARIAKLAGIESYAPTPLPRLDGRVWPEPELPITHETALRSNASAAAHFIDRVLGHGEGGDDTHVLGFLNEQLEPFQLVTVWRVNTRGGIAETTVPRVDSVERCCAYVVGLMLLDRHSLRRGIKECRLEDVLLRREGKVTGWTYHYFMDLPNSKRLYCCSTHAATDRKRRERATTTRKHK